MSVKSDNTKEAVVALLELPSLLVFFVLGRRNSKVPALAKPHTEKPIVGVEDSGPSCTVSAFPSRKAN